MRCMLALALATLAGCGGGGSDGSPDQQPQQIPAAANSAPVANAGTPQNLRTGSLVSLDGTASSDANGDALSYAWTLVGPAGSAAVLSAATSPKPSFTAELPGVYTATLVVNDGKLNSAPVSVKVTAANLNSAPVAMVGANQSVVAGSLVTLDGSASSDADGDLLAYDWILVSKPAGSAATLQGGKSAKPTFSADLVGSYVLSLSVFDGSLYSASATVTVTAAAANVAPVANAGALQNVNVGKVVVLDGTASSDANGDALSYLWTLTSRPAGSTAVLSSSSSPKPAFNADVAGIYVASLVVSDGQLSSNVATVAVTAAAANSAPVAKAGVAQNVVVGSLVTLDGTGSYDVDGDKLVYRWSLSSKPAGSTAGLPMPEAALPVFTADLPGSYVAKLVVNDGKLDSQPVTVTVTAAAANAQPVANAGPSQNVVTGTTVTLDGSGSSDANGDALSYKWTLTNKPAGSAAVLSSATVVKPTFVADMKGIYVVSLVVNDGKLSSASATVPISVDLANTAPVAVAGPTQNVSTWTTVQLDGSGSKDAEGDALSYTWALISRPGGSGAALSSITAMKPTFFADKTGFYVFTLKVNDGRADSNLATLAVVASNAAPVASAGAAQTVARGATVSLDGSASSDPNSDALSYLWTLVSKPAGSTAALSASNVVRPSFNADLAGSYQFSLVVSDGSLTSPAATVTITAN